MTSGVRRFLLGVLIVGVAGIGIEVLLIGHVDDPFQFVPLILLIPNAGPRMAREFEEYRPYKAIEQVRREMGKYVSDAEVARLERDVVVD
jgi:hypothetical protein